MPETQVVRDEGASPEKSVCIQCEAKGEVELTMTREAARKYVSDLDSDLDLDLISTPCHKLAALIDHALDK